MAAFYQTFTSSRTTEPDPAVLLAQLRALDATAGVIHIEPGPIFTVKKGTAWTGPQITAAQNVLDTASATTPRLSAQDRIDQYPIEIRALVLVMIDEINRLRAGTAPATAITPAQAIAAIRTKAGTL